MESYRNQPCFNVFFGNRIVGDTSIEFVWILEPDSFEATFSQKVGSWPFMSDDFSRNQAGTLP